MRLTEWLNHLFSRHSVVIDLGLDRIQGVYHSMLQEKLSCPVILVGGTNGKGSVSNALENIYRSSGYKTGLYTSPHLYDFRERFEVNGALLPEDAWVEAFEFLSANKMSEALTFFEFTTLAVLLLASKSNLDVLILEVGMGGRLDAVNIVPRDLSIITNVGLDHQDYLGDTREKIAKEKVGILHPGVPAVLGEPDLPLCVLEQAESLLSPVSKAGEDYSYHQNMVTEVFEYSSAARKTFSVNLPQGLLPSNAATAITAIDALQAKLPVSEERLTSGLSTLHLPARQQVLHLEGVKLILDVAHNPQAAHSLVEQGLSGSRSRRIWCVFSALQGKDVSGMVSAFDHLNTSWKLFELPGERAMPLDELQRVFDDECPSCRYEAGQLDALWLQLSKEVRSDDVILVFGSFQVIAALQPYLKEAKLFGGDKT